MAFSSAPLTPRLWSRAACRGMHVLAQDALHGVRPSSAVIASRVRDAIDHSSVSTAIVETLTAVDLKAGLDRSTLLSTLALARAAPPNPSFADAIRRLSEEVLYGQKYPFKPTRQRPPAATSRSSLRLGEIEGLSSSEIDALVQVLIHYSLHDRALLIVEHFVCQGWTPSPDTLSATFHACGWLIQARHHTSTAEVKEAHASAAWIQEHYGLGGDGRVAKGMLELLLRPGAARRSGGTPASHATGGGGASVERDEMLDLAFSLLPSLSEDVLSREGVLEKLIQLCIHRGRTEKAQHVISAMRARKVPVSVNCFNQLLLHSIGDNDSTQLHLKMMADAECIPDERTLMALLKHFLVLNAEGDVVTFLRRMSTSLGVRLSSPIIGYAALAAVQAGRLESANSLIALFAELPRRAGAGPPGWLRKLSIEMARRGGVGVATAAPLK